MLQQYGKYQLVQLLAVGGMAEVFLARQVGPAGFEKQLVVKRILPQFAQDDKFITMFLDEARLAAQLSHPNIVQIYELGEEQGTYYIAMEYIPGEPLSNLIDYGLQMGVKAPFHYAATIIGQVAAGLDYAHAFVNSRGQRLGLVHRDISPDNVLVSRTGAVKTIDFGIAKAVTNRTKTNSGSVKGKYCYMSPEQIMGQDLDGRSDIFSLGIVLYEMVTGQRPFGDDAGLMTVSAIVNDAPTPPSDLIADFPTALETIIYKALQKEREDRYTRARDMQTDLEQFVQTHAQFVNAGEVGEYVVALQSGQARDVTFVKRLHKQVATSPSQNSGLLAVDEGGTIAPPRRARSTAPRLRDSAEAGKFGGVGVASGHMANMATPPVPSSFRTAIARSGIDRGRLMVYAGAGLVAVIAAVVGLVLSSSDGPEPSPGEPIEQVRAAAEPPSPTDPTDPIDEEPLEGEDEPIEVEIAVGAPLPKIDHNNVNVAPKPLNMGIPDATEATSEPDAKSGDAATAKAAAPDAGPEPASPDAKTAAAPDAAPERPVAYTVRGSGRLTIEANMEGLEVYEGGELLGTTPIRGKVVVEGWHDLEVRAGKHTKRKRINVPYDGHVRWRPRIKAGLLTVAEVPAGVVCALGERALQREQLAGVFVKPGKHTLTCDDPASSRKLKELSVSAGQRLEVDYGSW